MTDNPRTPERRPFRGMFDTISDVYLAGVGFWAEAYMASARVAASYMTRMADIQLEWLDASMRQSWQNYLSWVTTSDNAVRLWSEQGSALKDFMRSVPRAQFDSIKQRVNEEFAAWEMPHPVGVHNIFTKEIVEQQLNFAPEAVAVWAKAMLMYNAPILKILNEKGVIAALTTIGLMLPGHGELYKADYNHQFLTQTTNGEIESVSDDDIAALFPVSDEVTPQQDSFPRIIITSSHAIAKKLGDMTDITQGIQALARDSQTIKGVDGKPLKITHIDGGEGTMNTEHSLVLFACDTERNGFLNAASLLQRLNDLDRIAQTGESDDYEHASIGAKRIARLIIKCMAQDPKSVPDFVMGEDERSIAEILSDGSNKILLRQRPELIAQHFQLIGYSKGGNVVSDALRYLINELQAVDDSGKPIFEIQREMGQVHAPIMDQKVNGDYDLTSIRGIIKNIACIAIASLESPLGDRYLEAGARRVAFNNRYDIISTHMPYDGREKLDERWIIEGSKRFYGHDPKSALGTLGDATKGEEGKRGYILDRLTDDGVKVARRIKEAFAPLFGKAVISDIIPTYDENGRECIVLETAAGTTDEAMIKKLETIKRALSSPEFGGLQKVSINAEGANQRIFRVYFDNPLFTEKDSGVLNEDTKDQLLKAFKLLRDSKTANLVISQSIIQQFGGPDIGEGNGQTPD